MTDITPGVPQRNMSYDAYRERYAKSAHILLHTPSGYFGRAIARHTGGAGFNFSHAEAIVWWESASRIMSCGYQEGIGGVARPLSAIVDEKSGGVHVYKVIPDLGDKRECLAEHLAGDLGKKYGWGVIAIQFLSLLPIMRLLIPQGLMIKLTMKASASSGVGICSQHVARSFRLCGTKLVDMPDAMVTPNDLAHSALTSYVCTLVKGPKK